MRVEKGGIDKRFKDDILFSQPKFKKAVKKSEHPDFSIDTIFDYDFKEGGKVKMAKPEKKKNKEKLASSLNKKVNKSFHNYYKY
tara:strand:+ start:432 stop:683 length:252 start_codon:yes stop_codon:yes gene_type:complete